MNMCFSKEPAPAEIEVSAPRLRAGVPGPERTGELAWLLCAGGGQNFHLLLI